MTLIMMTVGSPFWNYISKFKKIIFRKKVIVEIVVTGLRNKKGKSAKFREGVKSVLKYQFVRI